MNKKIPSTTRPDVEQPLLLQKTELATRAVDMLMFSGGMGQMVQTLGQMAGVPEVSIRLLFPTKRPDNTRPFLDSLNLIISTALDDQCGLDDFTGKLAEAIQAIKAIAEAEEEQ